MNKTIFTIVLIFNVLNSLLIFSNFKYDIIFIENITIFVLNYFLFIVFLVYFFSNILLLFGKRNLYLFWFNIYFSFIQILHFNIWGIIIEFSYGLLIMPGVSIGKEFNFNYIISSREIFTHLQLNFNDDYLYIGINIFQLLVFYIFNRARKSITNTTS
jgi:hypothetical protein